MQNRDKWVIEVDRSVLELAIRERISHLNAFLALTPDGEYEDTRLAFKHDRYWDARKLYEYWQMFVLSMEPNRKLFLTFEDYEFFFTDRI